MVVEAFELTELPDDLRRINSVDCCSGISSIVSAILGALGKTLHGAGKSRLKWKSLIESFLMIFIVIPLLNVGINPSFSCDSKSGSVLERERGGVLFHFMSLLLLSAF